MTSTKLFLLSLATLVAGGAAQCSSNCGNTLTNVQSCLRECVNKAPVAAWGGAVDFSSNGASRLWQCLPGNGKLEEFTNPDPLIDIMGCCQMSSSCNETMLAARTCSKSGCLPGCIKNSARRYMNCIVRASKSNTCRFAGLCVGQLTGNDAFDFATNLAGPADEVTSRDCSPLNGFVDGVCDISDRCCDTCNARMGALANCLVNRLLLPNSATGGAVTCQISTPVGDTCGITGSSAVAVGRSTDAVSTETPEDESDEEEVLPIDDDADISECEELLSFNFLVHNASHAVDEFMKCIGKQVGRVIVQSEEENNGTTANSEKDSAAAVCVFGTSVAFLFSSLLAFLTL